MTFDYSHEQACSAKGEPPGGSESLTLWRLPFVKMNAFGTGLHPFEGGFSVMNETQQVVAEPFSEGLVRERVDRLC